jgi:7-carboxy-7-deazaguanine synthase
MYEVQYSDTNVSPKYYSKFAENTLLVKSIFLTIQGEGPFVGHQAVFVRLAGCNRGQKEVMECPWCDTDFRVGTGKILTFEEISSKIQQELISTYFYPNYHNDSYRPLVVITGGEPMLQDNLVSFIKYLSGKGFQIQIESNGDRLAKDYFKDACWDYATLIVSPKIHPGTKTYQNLKDEVHCSLNYLKILVDARSDSHYHQLPNYLTTKNPASIYISPLTVYQRRVEEDEVASIWNKDLIDVDKTRANYEYAAEICMRNGFRLSLQTHLFLGVN